MKTFDFESTYATAKDCYFEVSEYNNGETALLIYGDGGGGYQEPIAKVTVNLGHIGEHPQSGNVFIKDYSEGEGNLHGLGQAGVLDGDVVREIDLGHGHTVYEVKIKKEYLGE